MEDLAGEAVPGLPATGRGHSLIEASAPDRYVTQLDAEGFLADFPATGDRGSTKAWTLPPIPERQRRCSRLGDDRRADAGPDQFRSLASQVRGGNTPLRSLRERTQPGHRASNVPEQQSPATVSIAASVWALEGRAG